MLVGNEIELGIEILMIGSRTSKVSRDKGNGIRSLWFKRSCDIRGVCRVHHGYPDPADDH